MFKLDTVSLQFREKRYSCPLLANVCFCWGDDMAAVCCCRCNIWVVAASTAVRCRGRSMSTSVLWNDKNPRRKEKTLVLLTSKRVLFSPNQYRTWWWLSRTTRLESVRLQRGSTGQSRKYNTARHQRKKRYRRRRNTSRLRLLPADLTSQQRLMESRQGDNYHKLSLSAAAVPCIHTYRRKHRASHKTLFSPFFSFFLHVFCLVIHLFLFSLGFFLICSVMAASLSVLRKERTPHTFRANIRPKAK